MSNYDTWDKPPKAESFESLPDIKPPVKKKSILSRLTSPSGMALVGLFFLLLAGGVAAYEKVITSPQYVFNRAARQIARTNSFHYESKTTVTWDIPEPEMDSFSLFGNFDDSSATITLDGDVDLSNPPSFALDFDGEVELDVSFLRGLAIKFEGLLVDDTFYFLLDELPFFSTFGLFGDGKEEIPEWIKISQVSELNEVQAPRESETVPYESLGELISRVDSKDRERILKSFVANKVFKLSENKGKSKINDKVVTGYEFRLNPAGLELFTQDLADIFEYEDDYQKQLDQLKDYSDTHIVMWFGLRDGRLHRAELNYDWNPEIEFLDRILISSAIEFSDFNKDISITAPEGAVDIKELYEKRYGASKRDTQRHLDLYAVTTGAYEYSVENNGKTPPGLTTEVQEIGTSEGKYDLYSEVQEFIKASVREGDYGSKEDEYFMDPSYGTIEATGYSIYINERGQIVGEAESESNPGHKIKVFSKKI